MRTCPACHRPVADDATICAHPDCGHTLGPPRPTVKRPPPPPRHIDFEHPKAPNAKVAGRIKSRRLVAISLMLLMLGLAAAGGSYFVMRQRLPQAPDMTVAINPQPPQPASMPRAEPSPAPDEPAAKAKDDGKRDNPQVVPAPHPTEDQNAWPNPKSKIESPKSAEPLGLVSQQPAAEPEKLGVVDEQPKAGLPAEPPLALPAPQPAATYAERTKPKTLELLTPLGGTEQSQAAVEEGLDWLARHQAYDGHWGADCVGPGPTSRCEPEHPCDGAGKPFEAAQTGLAVLAFQAGGHYYFNEHKYSDNVERGMRWLVERQSPRGWIVGSQNPAPELIAAGNARFQQYFLYEHAIATFALCEACAVAIAEGRHPQPEYLEAATGAVRFLEQTQHTDGGWRYTIERREPSDCSVSGWVMLALKTAHEAHIKVDQRTISRMSAFFRRHRLGARTVYKTPREQGTDAITGVGMLVDEFIAHKPHSSLVEGGATFLANKAALPWGELGALAQSDYYLWYNCTLAMFQAGGPSWQRWNNSVREHVVGRQLHGEACERGSWPPDDQWSDRGGRIYSTALAVLTLEVYYRFQRVGEQPAADEKPAPK